MMSHLTFALAKNKLEELQAKKKYDANDLDSISKIQEDLVSHVREKEITRQEEIKKKIHVMKESWLIYCKINSDCKENGLYFLSNKCNEIYENYETELKNLRVELCRERGE